MGDNGVRCNVENNHRWDEQGDPFEESTIEQLIIPCGAGLFNDTGDNSYDNFANDKVS